MRVTHSLLVLGLVTWFSAVTCRTIYLEMSLPTDEELSFMKRYGYLPEEQSDLDSAYTPLSIAEAIRKMQAFAGLPQTGSLDDETRSLFKKKRCGVKDIEVSPSRSRRRRYIAQQGWNKKVISYGVVNGSSTLSKAHIERLMRQGLAIWAPHGGLYFQQAHDHADIQVSFVSGDHGDGFPFDGPGRVVAHAFPPPHGAMHFDDDEIWSDNPDPELADDDVTDFFAVAVHEIGHALGLSHSTVKASVMYPYYQVPVERLHRDDILGMQELYLKDQLPQSNEATETSMLSSVVPRFTKADVYDEEDENDIPDLCYTNYDTITVINGKIYVFEEEWVWVLSNRKKIEPGYPQRFHSLFIGLPDHVTVIRTIYQRLNGNVVVFSGRRYWEFDRNFHLRRKGNIKHFSIPSQVPELSTVFLSNYNNKTYLIEYERFWRYDEKTRRMDKGYPKEMSAWRNIPFPVVSAMVWQGDTYFFRGPRFWRFDNALVAAHEYYPLPSAQVWFPCLASPDMDRYSTNDRP